MHNLSEEVPVLQILDEMDKKIIQEMANGINSYEELAKKFGVTRSTVYRRVMNLEKTKVVQRRIRFILDFEKLGLIVVAFGINITAKHEEEAVDALKKLSRVKMIWRTYGAHNIRAVAFCNKGEEGELINRVRHVLDDLGVINFEICVGYSWDKNDVTPF